MQKSTPSEQIFAEGSRRKIRRARFPVFALTIKGTYVKHAACDFQSLTPPAIGPAALRGHTGGAAIGSGIKGAD